VTALRTARVRREERRASLALALRKALDETGVSQREAATLVGVDEACVRRWVDAHEPLTITVSDLAALPVEVRIAVVVHELLPGHVVVREGKGGTDLGDDLEHALEMQRSGATVLSEQLAAIADGSIDAAEGARIERAVDEAIAALGRVREVARRAQRERSIPARTLRAVGRR
jgi:hypothetical protein